MYMCTYICILDVVPETRGDQLEEVLRVPDVLSRGQLSKVHVVKLVM